MSFQEQNIDMISLANKKPARLFNYKSTDGTTLSQIATAGFFDASAIQFKTGDAFWAVGSDDEDWFFVSSLSPTTLVDPFIKSDGTKAFDSITVNGPSLLNGTLTVAGSNATLLTGSLTVSGETIFNSPITANFLSTFDGSVITNASLSVNGSFVVVNDDATLQQNLLFTSATNKISGSPGNDFTIEVDTTVMVIDPVEDLVKPDNLRVENTFSLFPSTSQGITVAGITSVPVESTSFMPIFGSGGPIVITAVDPIAAGKTSGHVLVLKGTDNTNTVTVPSTGTTHLAGGASFTLGQYDILELVYSGFDGTWNEKNRSNNI